MLRTKGLTGTIHHDCVKTEHPGHSKPTVERRQSGISSSVALVRFDNPTRQETMLEVLALIGVSTSTLRPQIAVSSCRLDLCTILSG